MTRTALETCADTKVVKIPHLGVSLRTIMGACVKASAPGTRPTWKVLFNDTVVAQVRLKTVEGANG